MWHLVVRCVRNLTREYSFMLYVYIVGCDWTTGGRERRTQSNSGSEGAHPGAVWHTAEFIGRTKITSTNGSGCTVAVCKGNHCTSSSLRRFQWVRQSFYWRFKSSFGMWCCVIGHLVPDILKGCVVFVFAYKLDTNQQLLISKDSATVAAAGAATLWKTRAWIACKSCP